MSVTGVNAAEAHQRGADGVTVAETFTDVVSRFDTATEELATSLHGPFADDTVPFRRAYRDFAETYVAKMRDVQEHGSRLSGNVQAGAIEVARTDGHSAEEYQGSGEPGAGSESTEPFVEGHHESVEERLREHINERYVPGAE